MNNEFWQEYQSRMGQTFTSFNDPLERDIFGASMGGYQVQTREIHWKDLKDICQMAKDAGWGARLEERIVGGTYGLSKKSQWRVVFGGIGVALVQGEWTDGMIEAFFVACVDLLENYGQRKKK